VPSQANGSRGWQRTPDKFCSWVRISVAVRSRNAVEWRRVRDKSELVNQYATRLVHAKYAENAATDTTIARNGEKFVCNGRFRLSCAAVPTRKGSVA
jgi:kynureninase